MDVKSILLVSNNLTCLIIVGTIISTQIILRLAHLIDYTNARIINKKINYLN